MSFELSENIQVNKSKYENKKEDILKSVFKILEENNLLSLSTIRGIQPYSSSAYYSFDKYLNLYIWTEKNTRHSDNIEKNNKIAVNVADSSQKWGSLLKGLQMHGEAKIVSGTELIKAGTLYIKRFPKVFAYIKKISDFVSDEFKSVIYKLEINRVKLLDEKSFGKEEFIEILISRR